MCINFHLRAHLWIQKTLKTTDTGVALPFSRELPANAHTTKCKIPMITSMNISFVSLYGLHVWFDVPDSLLGKQGWIIFLALITIRISKNILLLGTKLCCKHNHGNSLRLGNLEEIDKRPLLLAQTHIQKPLCYNMAYITIWLSQMNSIEFYLITDLPSCVCWG